MIRIWANHGIYYGWVLVLTLALTQIVSWGTLYYAFGVFLTPMGAETGWSTAEMTGAFSLALLISGVAGLLVGRWLDRHGPRLLMTLGSCLAPLLVFAWSRVESLTAFYLIWAAIGLVMSAVLYEPAFYVVATWFRRGRAKALTVLTFVAGLASVIFIPLANWLVQGYGWRSALAVMAIVLAVATIPPHALLLRHRPSDLGLEPDGQPAQPTDVAVPRRDERSLTLRDALRDRAFWWLTASFVCIMIASTAATVHLIPYLIDRGFSPGFAAAAAGLIGLIALPGRLIFTPLGSIVSRRLVTAGMFLVQTVALIALLLFDSTAGVIAFVILFSAGFGAITPARAALIAEYYGAANYGSINSVLALFLTGARAIGPVGAGLLLARAGSYAPVFWVLTAISAVAIGTVLRAVRTEQPEEATATSEV